MYNISWGMVESFLESSKWDKTDKKRKKFSFITKTFSLHFKKSCFSLVHTSMILGRYPKIYLSMWGVSLKSLYVLGAQGWVFWFYDTCSTLWLSCFIIHSFLGECLETPFIAWTDCLDMTQGISVFWRMSLE